MDEPIDTENTTLLRDFNETQSNHEWSPFVCEGPSHLPTFKISLYLNNLRFDGCGSSKKKAKIDAIKNFNLYTLNHGTNSKANHTSESDIQVGKRKCTNDIIENSLSKKLIVEHQVAEHQTSAVCILHEIFPGQTLIYEHEQSHGILETISVIVSGNKYIGYGKSKKEAKEIACRNALKSLYDVQPIDNKFKNQIEMLRTDYNDAKIIDHFARITDIVYQKLEFDQIKFKEYSVIASIIKVNELLVNN